ncbi:Fic family protein [Pseudomonas aeruginosa]|uniref:Fic family protein n=1 Tax=Pseudomonas aeruginosa TaxID=287 RepID=UPI00193AE424|nr:Fic family protein [Pseudomonas aeruginosa]MBM2518635.1 Fic family protein [Pseudomonas aeruginosa]
MALTPLIPQDRAPGDLQDAVVELMRLDAALHANIPQPLRLPMMNLLRKVNSYYSNRIEGNSTVPADVLRAQDLPADVRAGEELLEIKRHIEAQKRLSDDPIDEVDICTNGAISRMHREFYEGMPEEFLQIKVNEEGETVRLVPGEFRDQGVKVGNHIPPAAENLRTYMNWFEGAYRLDRHHGITPILAAAASHHRLMWIHPFMDGNGRTGRLFTDQYLRAGGLGGYGLWSMSRGFGRNVDAYYAALDAADQPRKGDLDGRGELSDSGLLTFTRYFVETALDQVTYFSSLLEPRMLNQRIDIYFQQRQRGVFISGKGEVLPVLRIEAREVYKSLLYQGSPQNSEKIVR